MLDTSLFVSKWKCGNWPLLLAGSNIAANIIIMLSYYVISIALFYFYLKKKPLPNVFLFFIMFIFLCGTTHLFQAIVFWYPVYNLATVIDILTGIISTITCIILPITIRYFIKYKSPAEYEYLIVELNKRILNKRTIINNLEAINQKLDQRILYLENLVEKTGWVTKQELDLNQLRSIIIRLKTEVKDKIVG